MKPRQNRNNPSNEQLSYISSLHQSYDPLAYVLTHMFGELGWSKFIPTVERDLNEIPSFVHGNSHVTLMKYYSYRAQIRDANDLQYIDKDILLKGGKLAQQYWCDMWIKVNKIDFNI